MEFQKYSKLLNSYKQGDVLKAKEIAARTYRNDIKWLVSEKIHGANLSFWTDGKQVKVASRNQFVDDGFYGAGEVFEKYRPIMLDLFELVSQHYDVGTISVFGELFGGKIQKEVNYGETKRFVAFDMMIDGEYDSPMHFGHVLNKVGIQVSPFEEYNTLEEALQHPNDEPSYYSPTKDIREGVVIRPTIEMYYSTGKRVIFKNKNSAFTEKHSGKNTKPTVVLSEEENELVESIAQYITTNRVANVISKIGQVTQKDFGTIMKNTMEDVREDFLEEEGFDFHEDDRWDAIKKKVNQLLATEVRVEFVKHLEVG